MSDPSPSSPEFLQGRLSTLLASPHIHFNKPPALLNIRMGPGPVDVFSTRFANWFTHDATGVVNGKQVDKEGLKEALLALQKKWHPDSANFVAQDASSKPAIKFSWTVKNTEQPAEVSATADIKEEGGTHRISSLVLDGDDSLFSA
ncbi:hypothetical protein K466DRAFT_602310 [Polyporus arcularius HHB13444]|uniref:Uncharacterized protein n=1 Tax=Polyporus arcularius HHB13444 TaxID=1314778 RepID=A0A5C3P3P6_9APHY|nr:hypothetical protein K466DRAFT_602310 [Polyporus arcularius HHB13444]